VFSSSFAEHIKDLEEVFKRILDQGLYFKASKCFVCKPELHYLGHVVSEEGIKPDPKKISAITKIKTLKDKSELRSFLGMVSYYRKFMKNL